MICTSCGTQNPPGTQYCEVCGTPAAGARQRTALDAAPTAPQAAPDPSRKGRTLYDPGPARPAPSPSDVFSHPPPPRAPFDPTDPFAGALRPDPLAAAARPAPSATDAPPVPRPAQAPPEARPRAHTVLERAPAAAGAPAAVLWIAGPNPRLVPLGTGRTTLGRDPDNDVILEDDRVSGTHGFVFLKPDGAHYIDASRNGSVVDGEPILGESRPLRHGSVVALGGARVALLLVPAETVAALAATS